VNKTLVRPRFVTDPPVPLRGPILPKFSHQPRDSPAPRLTLSPRVSRVRRATRWSSLRRAVQAARRRRSAARLDSLIEAERAPDEAMALAVRDARRKGLSWASIGQVFGLQRHSAHERWRRVEDRDP
jgi:hypothetical protein